MEPTDATAPLPSASKRLVDAVNSGAWFTMDVFWMFQMNWPAYIAAGLTVLTGLLLLVLAKGQGRSSLYADLGVNCWIGMNTVWAISDLNGRDTPVAVVGPLVALGAIFILAAAWHSQDFRRLRIFRR